MCAFVLTLIRLLVAVCHPDEDGSSFTPTKRKIAENTDGASAEKKKEEHNKFLVRNGGFSISRRHVVRA